MRGSSSAPGLGAGNAFAGQWTGGPHEGITITIEVTMPAKELSAHYTTPSGEEGMFQGRVQHSGTSAKCFWVDPSIKDAARKHVSQTVELRLNPDGDSWSASAVTASGTPLEWRATRVPRPKRKKGTRLGTKGWYRNKAVFDRLTAPKNRGWVSAMRDKAMGESFRSFGATRNGMLSDTAPLCVGDPFPDKPPGPEPMKGASMYTTSPKKGESGMFSPSNPLAVGDPFEETSRKSYGRHRAAFKTKLAETGYTDRPAFRTGTPSKEPPRPFLTEVDGSASKDVLNASIRRARARAARPPKNRHVPIAPRNIQTNPVPKGGPGTPGVLLSNKSKEQLRILEYMPDVYEATVVKAREERKASMEARGDRPAFVPRVHTPNDGCFSAPKEVFAGAEPAGPALLAFRERPSSAPASRRRRGSKPGGGDAASEATVDSLPPYRPPYKHASEGTFGKFPPHVPDPGLIKVYKGYDRGTPWRQAQHAKSKPTPSVIKNRVNMSRLMSAGRSRR